MAAYRLSKLPIGLARNGLSGLRITFQMKPGTEMLGQRRAGCGRLQRALNRGGEGRDQLYALAQARREKARVARERAAVRKCGKKRVRFSLAVQREAVDLAAASGRARDAFPLDEGLSKTELQRWIKASRRPVGPFHHVKVGAASADIETERLVVVFPSGALLIGVSWEQIRQLLGVST
jgi:hypothetical protein